MKIDLSNSEWKLMNRLWQTAPMTITELTAALKEETGWSKKCIIDSYLNIVIDCKSKANPRILFYICIVVGIK